jgi:hypothetical protein
MAYHNESTSDEEDTLRLQEFLFSTHRGEVSTSGTKKEEWKTVLCPRSYIHEKQAPKDSYKNQDKAQSRAKKIDGIVKNNEKARQTIEDYNVLAHLRKIFTLLSMFNALVMLQDLWDVLIQAL